MNIPEIQKYLAGQKLDGWLMADFHARNNIAVEMLRLEGIVSRRSFYFIPAMGDPVGMVHAVEKDKFDNLPGKVIVYSGYEQLEKELEAILKGVSRIAMEYSPNGRLPYIGLVDAGTIELIRSFDVEIISSADLVANFKARLSPEQTAAHRIAAGNMIEIKDSAFNFVKEQLASGKKLNEYDVARHILDQFDKYDMETGDVPIVGVNANAGSCHYEPSEEKSAPIGKGDLLLIDMAAKLKHPDGIYADITWMAFTGPKDEIPAQYLSLFKIVMNARDAAVTFLRENIDKRDVYGAEVDDVCRKVIVEAGYGDHFTHRTGHSLMTTVHGPGPNIDNLETEDNRQLQKGHLFTIEPGIYLDQCGFRSEIDVLIGHDGVEITTLPLQTEITALL